MSARAHDLLEQPSVEATLERITGSATELAAGCDAAGILLLSGAEAQTLAPTNPLVLELDQLQHKLGQGSVSMPPAALGGAGLPDRGLHRGRGAVA